MSIENDNKAMALEQASAILGEHFEEFALCVIDRDYESFRWAISSEMMGKALFERGAIEITSTRENLESEWVEWDEDEDEEE
tara:strand:- start:132 stop:377 length:246 start_codon:yes stop_codon:yes gene_type:complete